MRVFALTICLLLTNVSPLHADQATEKLMSAYIGKFSNFVTWPRRFSGKKKFHIVVYENESMTDNLRSVLGGTKILKKSVSVKSVEKGGKVGDPHMLVVIDTDSPSKGGKNSLVITNDRSENDKSFHINFFIRGSRLKFMVNLKKVKRDGYKISSQLLKLAKVIK